jgi:hypothetical protein
VDVLTELVLTVNVALVDPAATVTLAGTRAAVVLLLASETTAPPVGAGPLNVTVPVEVCVPPVTLVGFTLTEESATALVEPGPCSKAHTLGFGSLIGTATNFVGDITYAMAFPPDGEVRVSVPLPFVGEAEIEYVAANDAPEVVPDDLLISSVPVRWPVGLAPSPENSPENAFTAKLTGLVDTPA